MVISSLPVEVASRADFNDFEHGALIVYDYPPIAYPEADVGRLD
jgi:hypothetical protein